MFDFDGFGQRLQKLRKQKNMTQGDFADRLGVTAQAVSKWENDLSYPDITLIPTIATIFNVEENDLFGFKRKNAKTDYHFPKSYDGMTLVHHFQNIACYSTKTVASIDGSGVKFTDGSSAELSNRLVVNTGKGEIKLLAVDDARQDLDLTKTAADYEFVSVENIDIEVIANKCEITRSKDGKCHVRARGDAAFIDILDVMTNQDTLIIRFRDKEEYNVDKYDGNHIRIELPRETGNFAAIKVNGSGELVSDIAMFKSGKISINGSGNIKMRDFASCDLMINGSGSMEAGETKASNCVVNGSGDLNWKTVENLDATINGAGRLEIENAVISNVNVNGSGEVDIANILDDGEMTLRVAGNGDVKIGKGYCRKLDINISGSGDVDAAGVTTQKASIIIKSSGKVTIGRVTDSSIEQIIKKGVINILKRGKE